MTCANYNKDVPIKDTNGFTFDKTINISTLIYALVLVVGSVLWFARLEANIAVHTSQIKTIQDYQSELKSDLVARLVRIEGAVTNNSKRNNN